MRARALALTAAGVAAPAVAGAIGRTSQHVMPAAADRNDAAVVESVHAARREGVAVGRVVAELPMPTPAPGHDASRLGEREGVMHTARHCNGRGIAAEIDGGWAHHLLADLAQSEGAEYA